MSRDPEVKKMNKMTGYLLARQTIARQREEHDMKTSHQQSHVQDITRTKNEKV
jgi:hypothetical protein